MKVAALPLKKQDNAVHPMQEFRQYISHEVMEVVANSEMDAAALLITIFFV